MPDEQFDRIEAWQAHADAEFKRIDEHFDRIDKWQRRADNRFDRIDEWQARADQHFDRIDERQVGADQRFERIEAEQHEMRTLLSRMDGRLEEVHQRVGGLHEDVLSRIAAIGDDRGPTKREMNQGFADLREAIGRRLDPLEAAVRDHSRRLNALDKRRR